MVYMGSKRKYTKDICPIIQKYINENNIKDFYDVFCGGANLINNIYCENLYASDLSPSLIALHQQAQDDFSKIPKDGSREYWDNAYTDWKKLRDTNFKDFSVISMPLYEIGAIEWYASFSNGGFPRGYAKNSDTRNYYQEAYRNHKKQSENENYQKINFNCINYLDIIIPENALIYCFDKNTEIMTEDGWKFLKDIDINTDKFFSREPETKKLDFLKATNYIHYHYKGKMINYKGRQIDFSVTPEHKIFYNQLYGRTMVPMDGFMEAKDFLKKGEKYRFIKAGGVWIGENKEFFDLCGEKVDFYDFCYLLGIFLTDGSINNQDSITISQTKPDIVIKIRNILNKLNISYTEHSYRDNNITFYLSRKYIHFFKQFYLKNNRQIPKEFKNATVPAIKKLIEGIVDGDGSENRKIYCPSYKMVGDIQECLYKIGLASNVREHYCQERYYEKEDRYIKGKQKIWIISILKTEYPPFYKRNISIKDYDDEVYCLTLEKWHTVLVKRNGKTIWLGQCDSPYKSTKPYAINPKFNHEEYYNWLREKSKTNPIFISEQVMPDDFKSIWFKEAKRTAGKDNNFKACENLYFIDNRSQD